MNQGQRRPRNAASFTHWRFFVGCLSWEESYPDVYLTSSTAKVVNFLMMQSFNKFICIFHQMSVIQFIMLAGDVFHSILYLQGKVLDKYTSHIFSDVRSVPLMFGTRFIFNVVGNSESANRESPSRCLRSAILTCLQGKRSNVGDFWKNTKTSCAQP